MRATAGFVGILFFLSGCTSGCGSSGEARLNEEFLEYSTGIEWMGDLPSAEQAKAAEKYLPVVWQVDPKEGEEVGTYLYGAFSSIWSESAENRRQVLDHFDEFKNHTLKIAWSQWLVEHGEADGRVRGYLRSCLEDPGRLELLEEVTGPEFSGRVKELEVGGEGREPEDS